MEQASMEAAKTTSRGWLRACIQKQPSTWTICRLTLIRWIHAECNYTHIHTYIPRWVRAFVSGTVGRHECHTKGTHGLEFSLEHDLINAIMKYIKLRCCLFVSWKWWQKCLPTSLISICDVFVFMNWKQAKVKSLRPICFHLYKKRLL